MASLPSENPYDAQGTVLYHVIPTTEYRAQLLGKTTAERADDTAATTTSAVSFKNLTEGGSSRKAGSSKVAAATRTRGTATGVRAAANAHGAGADGRPLVSSSAATAALNAQQQQHQRAALAASSSHASRSSATLGSTQRTGPTSSILLPGASKAAVSASRKPVRLAPLSGEEAASSVAMTGAGESFAQSTAGMGAGAGGAAAGAAQTLTVEKALAQLFQPVPVSSTRLSGSRSSDASGQMENDKVKTKAQEGDNEQGQGEAEDEKEEVPEWMQVASTGHTSRIDVVLLHQHLTKRCEVEHARPVGALCSTRESIFSDGYRELLRQVTVSCPERGLLMDELDQHMTLSNEAYDSLFDSACQYAARKSIERDLRSYLFDDKKKLESEVRRLENRVNELRAKHDGLLKRFDEQKTSTEKLQEEELGYLKKANQQLVSEIKRLSTLESTMNAASKASADGG